jgi:transposase
MATMQNKIFCIREFSKTESATAVQRAFRRRFNIPPPTRKSICRWNHQFDETGSLCKGTSTERSRVSEENVARIRECFERSPRKSTGRASRELGLPQNSVRRVLRRRLLFKPYRLQLVQALHANDKVKRA